MSEFNMCIYEMITLKNLWNLQETSDSIISETPHAKTFVWTFFVWLRKNIHAHTHAHTLTYYLCIRLKGFSYN